MDFLDHFLVRAHVAGFGIATAAAPLGCILVWRRMAFFGDATAHAAILGVALSLAADIPIIAGVLLTVVAMSLVLSVTSGRGTASDALLAVLSHGTLACGLVGIALIGDVRIDLIAFLFGDILAVGQLDLAMIWGGAALALALTAWRWSPVLTVIVSPELAQTSNIDPRRERFILNIALAITIAVAIKVVGVLLITAMLIIPATTARAFASTPERMALMAFAICSLGIVCGLYGSVLFDTPAGPTIVACLTAMFIAGSAVSIMRG